MALLRIDSRSSLAPYEQVRGQIVGLIEAGTLKTGVRLPTVRRMAGDLGLAVNTVARAYRELELAGYVETDGRRGTFVAGQPSERRRLATETVKDFLSRMRDLGIDDAETMALIRRELGDAERSKPGHLVGHK